MAGDGSGGLDELSHTLRQLREAAGPGRRMTLTEAAALAGDGFSTAKLSRIERGRNVPSPDDVDTLTRIYNVDAATRVRLRALADSAKAAHRRIILGRRPDRSVFQRQLGAVERASEQIREFSPIIIPGLVQTAEYIRAVFESTGAPAEQINQAVQARLGRQAILDEPGRRITILTTEGALGWCAGTAPMMVRQMEHIAAVTQRPRLRVGIIPFGARAGVFPVSNWTLYDERACVPGVLATQVILNDADVAPYVEQYERLEPLAVFDDKARALLTRAADRYRKLPGTG